MAFPPLSRLERDRIRHLLFTTKSARKDEVLMNVRNRLEAATSRLEDIASSVVDESGAKITPTSITPPSAVAASAPSSTSAPEPQAAPEPLPRSVEDFDKLLEEDIATFVTASGKIGGLVEQQVRSPPSSLPPLHEIKAKRLPGQSRPASLRS